MPMQSRYSAQQPQRSEVDALEGPVVLEFGTDWCGHCSAAQPYIAEAFTAHEQVRHLKIEDGPGRPLGRSFRVKLWPTLIFMANGTEVKRLVRPTSAPPIRQAMAEIDP